MTISKSNLNFLKKLEKNNNREWFNSNKELYIEAHQNTIDFADDLISELNNYDVIETESGKKSLMRIYRDVRFSKDKSPYKPNWGGGFKRASAGRRGGYYFHIQPGGSFAAGGFWAPDPQDLALIRSHLDQDDKPLRKVIKSRSFVDHFGELQGEQVKSAPKGYTTDNPAIDLLRYKQFLVSKKFEDKEVLAPDFVKKMAKAYAAMIPFFTVITEMLTTDLNGVSLIKD